MQTSHGLPRLWLLALASLLALAPLAIVGAQSGPGGGPYDPGASAPGRQSHDLDDDNETADEDDEDDDENRSGRGQGGRNDDDEDDDDEEGDDEEDDDSRSRDNFRGHFQLTGAGATGQFVSFTLTDAGVADYAYRNATVFTSIDFDPALGADEVSLRGASFAAEGPGGEFRAVDNPTGHFRAESDDGHVTLTLAPGYVAELLPRNGSDDEDDDDDDDRRARITGPGNFTAFLSGDDLTVAGGMIAGDELRFLVHAPGRHGALSPQIDSAIANGTIGAEVVVEHGRTRSHAPTSVPVVNGNLNLTVEDAQGRVRVVVEGHGAGRALLFNIERDALGRAEDFVVVFDGAIIGHADDLADVLDIQADEPAEYVLVVGRNSTQVVVQVPHFSTHTVEIQGSVFVPLTPVGSFAAFAVAGGLAVAVVTASWTARNRQR